jgi:DNA-directed RNA polymerase subunit RPC12/RpoP
MITKTILELNKIFKLLNKQFFEDKLVEPIILIQTKSKKHTLGTCSTNPIWQKKDEEKDKKYEITLSGAYLNRTLEEIVATLLHEMIHLYCSLNKIKDTSNNCVYHNKKFKEEAEKRGLIIEKDKTIGWSLTKLTEDTIKLIPSLKIDNTAFDYWRNALEFKVDKPKITLNKYQCPQCETKVTSSKTLNIICGDCNKKFELMEGVKNG